VSTDHPLTRAEAQARAHALSGVSYEVTLDLTGDGRTFTSHTRVRFTCAEATDTTFIDLVADSVETATLNGQPLPERDIAPGRITLRDLAETNILEVSATCAYERTGVGLHRFVDPADGEVYLHTQFEPFDAHRVYACFDQPDLKAPFALTVRAPKAWEVVSNSAVDACEESGDTRVWQFAPTLPLSTYLTAVVAGPFRVVRGTYEPDEGERVELGIYCRPALVEHLEADEILEITRQGFDYYTEVFGYPYPFGGASDPSAAKKYDQLFVPEFNWGGMENPGCVTYSESYIFRSRVTDAARQSRAEVLLHELAHMWFGDLVTMIWWDDLWLNESFATYASYRAMADATRFAGAWTDFANSIKSWALSQDQLPSTHPISADIDDTEAVRTNFDGITYAKGASVLRQLVAWVGDEAFFSGLRDYFQAHALGNASLADFLSVLEKASGRDLTNWSKEWLETAGVATLRPVTEIHDGRYASVAVIQEAADTHPTLRSHRAAIGLYDLGTDGLSCRRLVETDIVGERTEVDALAGEPRCDLLLVNDGDLTFAKLRLDDHSTATVVAHLSSLDDPLARALCWGAAWDMTRDAELPTRRWIELVAAHAASEHDPTLLQWLLARARAAADLYGDPANRPAARAVLAGAAREALEASAPSSDEQLAWLRHLVDVADGQEHITWVVDVLHGDVAVPGVTIDTELRWHLIARLSAAGAADEALITAELARDDTDMGRRRAAAARAARPDHTAKEQAWEALLTDRDLSLAMLKATAGGFWQAGQDELLDPYVDRFAEAVATVWDQGRVNEEAIALTHGLYPSTIADERMVAAARRLLTEGTLPRSGARIVAEAKDGTERALRARAADIAAGG
jgi:aminopeptidase N